MKVSPQSTIIIVTAAAAASPLWLFVSSQEVVAKGTKRNIRHSRSLLDGDAPVLTCKDNVQLSLTGTTVAVATTDVQLTATDNVGITNTVLNAPGSPYNCAFIGLTDVIRLTVADAAGNTASCEADVTVVDKGLPTAACTPAVTAKLGGTSPGTATITPSQINNGSTDNCDTALALSLSQSTFTCADVGPNVETLTVTDDNANSATCTSVVSVVDDTPPTLTCQGSPGTPFPVQLTTEAATLPIGSVVSAVDNCAVDTITPATTTYGCADVGDKTFTATATDVNSNAATCVVKVRVFESVPPNAVCVTGPINLGITAAAVSLTTAAVNNGSSDNCNSVALTLSKSTFGCADLGANTVTLTVKDPSDNTDTCTVTVNVADTEAPDVDCVDKTVSLGSGGTYTLTQADVLNNGDPPDDNCGEPTLAISRTSFSCADVSLPPVVVTNTATDGSGNQNSCTSTITVRDTTGPTILACAAQSINLSAAGTASINKAIYTATDNCGLKAGSPAFSKESFTCANRGANPITVTFLDVNSNTSTCNPTITVVDNTKPVMTCPASITVSRTADQSSLTVPLTSVTATDNCGPPTLSTPAIVFDCDNSSTSRSATVTATDAAGNTATCVVPITIAGNTELDCGGGLFALMVGLLTCGLL